MPNTLRQLYLVSSHKLLHWIPLNIPCKWMLLCPFTAEEIKAQTHAGLLATSKWQTWYSDPDLVPRSFFLYVTLHFKKRIACIKAHRGRKGRWMFWGPVSLPCSWGKELTGESFIKKKLESRLGWAPEGPVMVGKFEPDLVTMESICSLFY